MDMSMDHAGHNHSAHASVSPPMAHDHGAVLRHEDGSYYYSHGAWLGHVVPGSFFLLWGVWWMLATFYEHLASAAGGPPFRSRGWHRLFFGTARARRFPVEPFVKIVLPLFGILGELWLGHDQYMNLYASDGRFVMDHVNDWQHSAMYSAFMLSGLVDLATWYGRLPEGIEHASLGMAFLIEGMLLVFHLKGPKIEILVHLILVIQIFLTVVAVVFEALMPTSFAAALARPLSTVIQGVWWIQTAYIMYRAKPQWDPEDMSSAMMAPVAWVTHVLWITAAMLSVFLLMRWVTERHLGWVYKEERGAPGLGSPMPAARYGAQRPSGRTNGHIDLELSALTSDKY
ncbi:hypothetical protein ACKKBF_B13955 [Auxenochlorella protothecoides x Auxenochlorella symbiontica]